MLCLDSPPPKKSPSARQALSAMGYILDLFHTETTRKLLKMIPIRFQFLQFNVKITDMIESLRGKKNLSNRICNNRLEHFSY